ncbi:MAG: hypothetical protein DHS20C21_07280 [Gemmatimonadota bacterium]|nr:MAG: hypothetical protein DHS20C21_07280 [Gemmatimonadota bacterium]
MKVSDAEAADRVAIKRVLVLGEDLDDVLGLIRETDLILVQDAPDVVLTYGGDGLLLGSERRWPGVPKLPLRHSRHGKKCQGHEVRDALRRLVGGDLVVTRHDKVEAEARGRTVIGLNDVLVHNSSPTSSVRYRVWINDVEFGDEDNEIVGDGVVVATPFGSTAYYRSITRSTFGSGLGLAFNNSTEAVDHLVLPADAVIRVQITRGPALLAADNDAAIIPLGNGDEATIRMAATQAVLLNLGVG